MDLTFAKDTYYLILLHVVSICMLVSVNFAIWLKAKKIPLLYSYLSVQLVLLLWMVAKILKTVAPDVPIKFLFVVVQYTGVCFLSVMFFVFAYLYATGRLPKKKTICFLSVVPFLSLLTLITNPYHGLFYSRFDFWGDTFGPAFYIHQAYSYVLFIAGMILCSRFFFRQFGAKHMQAVLFSAAILIPLAANVFYVFGWIESVFGVSPPCDITPISCNLSLLMFALAVFRFRFFDGVKIARRTALDALPDGILILDRDGCTADYNETFQNMYSCGLLYSAAGEGILPAARGTPVLKRGAADLPLSPEPRDVVFLSDSGRYIRLVCRAIERNNRFRGTSFQFSDVTLRQALLKETARKNQELRRLNSSLQQQARLLRELTAARTRNFIAREIHDILGHSVVLVLSILETARFSVGKEDADLRTFLRKAKRTLQECSRKSPLTGPDAAPGESGLVRELRAMIREVRSAEIEVELTVTGQPQPISPECAETIFKMCREGVTNAIRHGGAQRIDLILRSRPGFMEAYIIDNGRGCQTVRKGVGLTGMEERLRLVGGKFGFGPMEGGGFRLYAGIPVR